MKLTLDYEVCLTVEVDTTTGKVEGVYLHPQEFNASLPANVFNNDEQHEDLPEYLPLDHPEALKAIEIGEQVKVTRWNAWNGSGDLDAEFTQR